MRIVPPIGALAIAALFFVMLNVMLIDRARAGDPTGIWLIEDRDAEVRVAACGKALCVTVVWIQQPNDPDNGKPWVDKNNTDANNRSRPLLGLTIINDMTPSPSPNKWEGHVYSILLGKQFDGSLTLLNPTKIKIEGCLMALLCQSEIWTKQIDGGNVARSGNSTAR
jgi:uncharacterized protein (DUF2147 family)